MLPSDPGYDADRRDFNLRFDVYPRAIVYCREAGDVANAVTWARANRAPISVRSGGHSYEAFSLGPGLVIDLSEMNALAVDVKGGTATAQPGVRLIDFYRGLAPAGVTVPAGTCGGVGLSGLTLGGGAGYLSRMWGLTSDNLRRVEMVDGRGSMLTADASTNADLFWALRGGGGSFGIVTALSFEVHAIGDVVAFTVEWPFAQAGAVLSAWQQHAPSWPDEMTGTLEVQGTPAGAATCSGMFLGDEAGLRRLLTPLLSAGPDGRVSAATMPYIVAAEHFADGGLPGYRKMKSDFGRAPLGAEAIDVVLRFMARSPHREDTIQFQGWGGAINRVPAAATAFPHRAMLFLMQYITGWTDAADAAVSLRWIDEFFAAMRPYVSGYAYSNMCDLDLTDWEHAYYGSNFDALVAVKTKYDPDNVFDFAQSIPTGVRG